MDERFRDHFLADFVEGEPEFKAEPWYNPCGDCIIFQMADEAIVADRIDELLTIYRSAVDDRPIGFQIKGVAAIIKEFGWDGLVVQSEAVAESVKLVSIAALLLVAYDQGPRNTSRLKAYAAATAECPPEKAAIRADDLQPA